ncbi:exodeoxyribonuclease VII small subunit [Moraxella nonliquefaciens]|uniref:exodeoxyribonuclease VII small subunit n=1 Tax=Moraxella nonliquefaciens TaxID=478 RepID=UPI00081F3E99|nr:exodeoxyribonuclease VII small subunit [Moraxella nonliquefaciens]OBX49111.1 hypothetical protein A9Z65_02145 [Moraxella nonliquefaciens]
MPKTSSSPTTFKEAYDILKRNADALEQSQTPDIDNLLDVVEQSIGAYRVCQERISAVEQALKHAFDIHKKDDTASNN